MPAFKFTFMKILVQFHRIWLNKSIILKRTCTFVGGIYTFIGFLSIMFSFEGILPKTWEWRLKLLCSVLILFMIFMVCLILSIVCILRIKEVKVLISNSNHKVVIKYGDMYNPNIISKGYVGRRNIVVSVNRCFDTIVDNDLVSDRTQHGKILKKLYERGLYNEYSMNETIQRQLQSKAACYNDLTVGYKSKGNTFRYDVGTVAEIEGYDNIYFFFLGLINLTRISRLLHPMKSLLRQSKGL